MTGKLIVGPVPNTMPPDPVTLFPNAVTTPVPVAVVAGAAPAPPPSTIAFNASAAELAHVLVLEK